jgi:hypothetical protein
MFYFYIVMLRAGRVQKRCRIIVCSNHLLESDFITAGRIHLNKGNQPHISEAGLNTLVYAGKEHYCI